MKKEEKLTAEVKTPKKELKKFNFTETGTVIEAATKEEAVRIYEKQSR